MKHPAFLFALFCLLSTAVHADPQRSKPGFKCDLKGGFTVDSLFRAVPSRMILIEPERQKARPDVLDRNNGYMNIKYRDGSGNSIEYTAALYIGGKAMNRTFIIITRDIHPVAQLPSTEKYWVFEYSSGTCSDQTVAMIPWKSGVSTVRLPRKGTDLEACEMKGGEAGIKEECTVYTWDVGMSRFGRKK